MKIYNEFSSNKQQHYLFEQHYSFRLKPKLVYSGLNEKTPGMWGKVHSHDFAEILFVVKGSGRVYFGNENRNISKGDLVIYNAGTKHIEFSNDQYPLFVYFIAIDNIEINDLKKNHLIPPHYNFVYSTADMYQTFKRYFQIILEESSEREQFYSEIAANMTKTLVMYVFRLLNKTENTNGLFEKNKILEKVKEYINENFASDINLDIIANECYVNKYYISHLFSEHENISIGKYILYKRLDKSCKLLEETQKTVAVISVECGFNDMSYFCRAFKKVKGITPLQYRKNSFVYEK